MIARTLILFLLLPLGALGATVSYEFDIDTTQMTVTDRTVEALAIDGQIPAPTIRASVGDTLRVTFNNRLDTTTSVHWHGILLPADQDGVPFLNTQPIAPGGSHTFEFPIRHHGTFWYHSHTELQIQHGLYGAVVLNELDRKGPEEHVVLLSDWTDEDPEQVLANLKKADDFYAWKKGKVQSWDQVLANGSQAVRNRLDNAYTRMGVMDLTDVGYDAFLVNGRRENTLALKNPAAPQLKLRLVNGSTSSYFDVEYAGGPMTVIAADGQDVEALQVRRLRISTAETYDVLVPLTEGQAFELRATSFDGTGHSSLFVGAGQRVPAPDLPAPNLYLSDHQHTADMGMDTADHAGHGEPSPDDHAGHVAPMVQADHAEPLATADEHSGHSAAAATTDAHSGHSPAAAAIDQHSNHPSPTATADQHSDHTTPVPVADDHSHHGDAPGITAASAGEHAAHGVPATPTGAGPVIEHMTDYRHLAARESTSLPADQPWRDIHLTLTGNMERYVWSFDGKTIREDPQVMIRAGENLRVHLSNDTMMHHPLHLHGHFFRVVNDQGDRSPLKHTVNVPPMGHVVIEFDANERQDWLFHCHNQYHMKSGMNRVVSYAQTSHFNEELAGRVSPAHRWFRINEFHLLSSFADYEYTVGDERHSFELELDTNLDDTMELHLFYNYHFNRFVSAFGGLEKRQHHHGKNHDLPVAGLNILLPFMVESEWRIDDHGEFRLELQSAMRLTRHVGFDWRWNSDDEHRWGFNYRLSNRLSITVHTDTEYGEGIGIQFFY